MHNINMTIKNRTKQPITKTRQTQHPNVKELLEFTYILWLYSYESILKTAGKHFRF